MIREVREDEPLLAEELRVEAIDFSGRHVRARQNPM
jgi:hypothetical protein